MGRGATDSAENPVIGAPLTIRLAASMLRAGTCKRGTVVRKCNRAGIVPGPQFRAPIMHQFRLAVPATVPGLAMSF